MGAGARTALLGLLAGLCGLAWGQEGAAALMACAAVLPLLWGLAPQRVAAGLIAGAYFLASSRGLPFGAGIFFAETAPAWFSWALWLGAAAVNAVPWALCWGRSMKRRAIGAPIALAMGALPPIGIVGWCNPLTASGWLYPAMGLAGLALMVAWSSAIAARRWPVVAILASAGLVANLHAVLWPAEPLAAVSTWRGQDTSFPGLQSAGKFDPLGEGQRMMVVRDLATQVRPGEVLVLPETVLPPKAPGSFAWLLLDDVGQELQARGATLIAGTELQHGGGRSSNALVAIGAGAEAAPMVQRVPVPIGMWRPWAADGFDANLWGHGVAEVRGLRVAYVICYEQLLVWPIVTSLAQRPVVLVGTANDWWARDTSIPSIQRQAVSAWARLFEVPAVQATNL